MKQKFRYLMALMLPVLLALPAASAWGATAANTQIYNNAILTYNGGLTANASVTVSVALVPAKPTLVLGNNGTPGYTGVNTPTLTDTLTMTSNANGPATYTVTTLLGSGADVSTNILGGAAVQPSLNAPFSVDLGASVTTATASHSSSTTTLVIPEPDAAHIAPGPIVNGLGVGDKIQFTFNPGTGVTTFTRNITAIAVDSVDHTVTLTFSGLALAAAPPAGMPVFEQQDINSVVVGPGTVDVAGTNIVVKVYAQVTTPGVTATDSNIGTNTWTTPLPSVNFVKYVRNATPLSSGNPTAASAGATLACYNARRNFTVNGSSKEYFPCNYVTAVPGDFLEYVIVAENSSATSDLTATAISDAIPFNYVSFITPYTGGKEVYYSDTAGGANYLTANATTGQARFNVWPLTGPSVTLTVNVGVGATALATGTIPKEAVVGTPTSCYIAYQVQVR
jgi:hypothetical protein